MGLSQTILTDSIDVTIRLAEDIVANDGYIFARGDPRNIQSAPLVLDPQVTAEGIDNEIVLDQSRDKQGGQPKLFVPTLPKMKTLFLTP